MFSTAKIPGTLNLCSRPKESLNQPVPLAVKTALHFAFKQRSLPSPPMSKGYARACVRCAARRVCFSERTIARELARTENANEQLFWTVNISAFAQQCEGARVSAQRQEHEADRPILARRSNCRRVRENIPPTAKQQVAQDYDGKHVC